jgi:hypothetical protein
MPDALLVYFAVPTTLTTMSNLQPDLANNSSGPSAASDGPVAMPSPCARAERRQIARARISMRMRVRTADFSDGTLEHVGNTLNASRTAFYFRTPLNRYYRGMRLRITLPYEATAHSCLEEMGEVVRVDEGSLGHGVAVTRTALVNLALSETRADRRTGKRFPFVAGIELTDVRVGNPMHARTSDLSVSGCYVDTLNPCPAGTILYFRMHKAPEILEACAMVCTQHQGCGMGLQFKDLTAEQHALLQSWLGADSGTAEAAVEASVEPAPAIEAADKTGDAHLRLGRLVDILNQKGVLSPSEVAKVSRALID